MRNCSVLLIILWLINAPTCWAQGQDQLTKENAELRKRVETLEQQLDELKGALTQQPHEPQARSGQPVSADPKTTAPDAQQRKPVWSNLDVQLYGYVKLDAAYDTSRISTGNFARWVESEATNKNDDQFNMTANQTRLGLKIAGPADGEVTTTGLIEIDFYGAAAENKPEPMMRHAYMELNWPNDGLAIIAGQTWDVISPLVPSTLNYSVQWWAGNIGYRRPQIRLTKTYAFNEETELKLQGALVRTIGLGGDSFTHTPGDAGEDAGFPGLQARVGLTFPLLEYKPTTIGVSGHWAKEELDISASGDSKNLDSWSLNLDLAQPVNHWLVVKGELFTGENLNAYLGGIGQGINTTTFKEIGTTGGWLAANLGPWDNWRFTLGVSAEDVDDGDLAGISGDKRQYNRCVFGNAIYSINKSTDVGLEISQWNTKYDGQDDADGVRAQMAFIYKF